MVTKLQTKSDKTRDVILCCPLRVTAHCSSCWEMSMEQRWNDEQKNLPSPISSSATLALHHPGMNSRIHDQNSPTSSWELYEACYCLECIIYSVLFWKMISINYLNLSGWAEQYSRKLPFWCFGSTWSDLPLLLGLEVCLHWAPTFGG
jgi:hypothetical protein